MLEIHDGTLLSDALAIHLVELPKRTEDLRTPEDAPLRDWAIFLGAETDEERRKVAMHNADIEKATEALADLSQDPRARELAQWRRDQLLLHELELSQAAETARTEGEALGRAQGEALGRAQGEALGRAQGEAQTLRRVIEAMASMLNVEMSPERSELLGALDASALSELFDHLQRERRFPD